MAQGTEPRSGQSGMALVVAAVFLAVAVLILAATAMLVVNQSHQTDAQQNFQDCFNGLEAGIVASAHDLAQGGTGMIGLEEAPPLAASGVPEWPAMRGEGVSPRTSLTMPNVEYLAFAKDWFTDGVDNNGDGITDGPEEENYYNLYAMASIGGVVRKAEVTARVIDVNVWNNALFGGAGTPGGVVYGDADIHGSVHVTGDEVLEGNAALGGNATRIRNSYEGLDDELLDRLPELPTRVFRGDAVGTLGTMLRVRNGLMLLSGDSVLGEVDVPGNRYKETLDGTYVSDGWVGSTVEDDGIRGLPETVFSDNGSAVPYNLGEKVKLPLLSEPYRELGTGEIRISESRGRPYTHTEFFNEELTGEAFSGTLTITTGQDFYYNATRPDETNPDDRLPDDDYLYFDGATNVLEANGQIEIDGDLRFAVGSGDGSGGGGTQGQGGSGGSGGSGSTKVLAGTVNINPNNKSDFEFMLVKPDGTAITRDDLLDSRGNLTYSGKVKFVRFKPKGNGNQNSLTIDGVAYPLKNSTTYTIWADNLSLNLYNDKPGKSGAAMGHWWISNLAGTNATVAEGAVEPPEPEEEQPGMIIEGQDPYTIRYKGKCAILVHGDVHIGTGLVTGDAEIVPAEDIAFDIQGDRVTPREDFTASVKVLGAAISYSGEYDMPVTARLNVGGAWSEPWGAYDNANSGNLNDGRAHPYDLPDDYPADTSIGVQAQSWYKQGNKWRSYLSADSWAGSQQVIVLRNGDPVPDIEPFLNQTDIHTYVKDYVDAETQRIELQKNQAIFLFELGTSNLNSDAADFQDLVVLVSLLPPKDGTGGSTRGQVVYKSLPFPEHILGIMAEDELEIRRDGIVIDEGDEDGSTPQVMGALYAQSRTSVGSGATVVGGVVANVFHMESPVPRIFHVPALPENLPRGMIGGFPILAAERLCWREIGVN